MALENQKVLSAEQLGAVTLSDEIEHVVGVTATVIEKPVGKNTLIMAADKGGWRVRLGDQAGDMPATEFPAATVNDGTGALYLGQGGSITLPGPSNVTVKGYAADSVLTYWWV